MKNKNIILYISALFVSLMAVSCAQEMEAELGAADNADCYGVYFPSQKGTGDLQIGPDDKKSLVFSVRRLNTIGAVTVPVTIESEHPGVFSVSELRFEEDSPTAELEVFFPTIKLGVRYDCTIKVEGDEYVSNYSKNATHLSFNVTCVKWNKLIGDNGETTGLWRDGVLPEWFNMPNPNLEKAVTIEERADLPGYYRIYDIYDATYMTNMFNMNANSICLEQHYTYIDATDPEKVWIPTFKTGIVMSAEYGEMSIGSYVAENEDFDPSIASIYGTLEDGVISFPANALQLHFAILGWYPSNSYGLHRIILPGYRAVDESIAINPGITEADGYIPVDIKMGLDVSRAKVYTAEGALAASEVAVLAEDIAAGKTEANQEDVTGNTTLRLSFDKTGEYTIIVVGLDSNGALVNYSFATFGYKKAAGEKEVELNIGLISSDKYAPDGMTSENSLELYINGKDIKRLHVGLFEKETFDSDEDTYWASIRETELNEQNLALVNGSGLSLVQSGLVPGTEYVLAVVANNGYSEVERIAVRSTGGVWDYRLASYSSDDIDIDATTTYKSAKDWCGTYNYYAMEGTSSRYCLGEVVIEESDTKYNGTPCVKVSGLFPHLRKTYGVKDDSMDFYFSGGRILNYQLCMEYFIFEGMYVYTNALLYATNGAVYSGAGGLAAAVVEKKAMNGSRPCIAILDSGANSGVRFTGFALVGFEDSSQTVSLGLLDLVESMVLVPKDQDPNPIYPPVEEKEDDEEDMKEAGLKMLYYNVPMFVAGQAQAQETVQNFFNLDKAIIF